MGRHQQPTADGSESAASIMFDPFEHTYTEELALKAYRQLSSKRAMQMPENQRTVTTVGKILKFEPNYWNRAPLDSRRLSQDRDNGEF